MPSAGFAVIPEYESEPPHCNASVNLDNGDSDRSMSLILGSSSKTLLKTLLII